MKKKAAGRAIPNAINYLETFDDSCSEIEAINLVLNKYNLVYHHPILCWEYSQKVHVFLEASKEYNLVL